MPFSTATRASKPRVHLECGRPYSEGLRHAIAQTKLIWFSVNWGGAPGRGASINASRMAVSSTLSLATASTAISRVRSSEAHRERQRRTRCRSMWSPEKMAGFDPESLAGADPPAAPRGLR
jgi:hypothetical protein